VVFYSNLVDNSKNYFIPALQDGVYSDVVPQGIPFGYGIEAIDLDKRRDPLPNSGFTASEQTTY
jgi:hypothetical protein